MIKPNLVPLQSRWRKFFPFIAIVMLVIYNDSATSRLSSNLHERPFEGDSSYVEILPPIGGFGNPRAIMIGNDQLLYVADYDSNKIFMLDANGIVLNRREVLHPISIAQNSKFDLYVGGETLIRNQLDTTRFDTIGAIYKINLVRFDTTYMSRIDTVIDISTGDTTFVQVFRDTSYIYDHDLEHAHERVIWNESLTWHPRRFVGIGIFPNDDFLVARNGPYNTSFIDPDTRVLLFNNGDTLITPLGDLVTRPSGGSSVVDIAILTNIAVVPGSKDFIITQNCSGGVPFGTTWMLYHATPDFSGWIPRFDPSRPNEDTIDFIQPNRFSNVSAVAIDHVRREVFIVDIDQDSVVKFDWNGNFMAESFGKNLTGSGALPGLHRPTGAAFSDDGTLYIADSGNKIVRRFKHSVSTEDREIPTKPHEFSLQQNYPNPFNSTTIIRFTIPNKEFVTLRIYDLLGRELASLVEKVEEPGEHVIQWDASNVPSGVYFYRLQSGSFINTKKLLLIR